MIYNTPVLKIPNATPSDKDAAQNMFYKGIKRFNMCGEMSVALCMQDEAHTDNIDDFLSYWEAKEIAWWQTIIKKDRGTGIYDLKKMLSAYDAVFTDLIEIPIHPFAFALKLETCQAIIGVNIDHTGYLVGRGIRHWVVLDKIKITDSNHALVRVYNSYTNYWEPNSWRELMTSTGAYKQGLWIER